MEEAQNNKFNEVMTLAETAEYLQLSEKTVLRMCQKNEIPGAKIASQWRFMRSVIRDWLAGQMQTIQMSRLKKFAQPLLLHEIMSPDLIILDIQPDSKISILKQLMIPLKETGFAKNPQVLFESLIERERMMTTAIGHGIAIPHPRKPIPDMFSEPAVLLGICKQGTNFEAVDDRLVHLFFVICSTREDIHLQLMAKISWLCRQEKIVAELQKAATKNEVIGVVRKASQSLG
ncbi:MAG: PTS sugar transporter subunit IIA [Sedimentisphaerales bacterium]|nr:PTS sugar transporter subunit IIA [Sedimentisphaerales bacterium]